MKLRMPGIGLYWNVLVVAVLIAGAPRETSARPPQVAEGTHAAVVSVSPPATEIGIQILKRGGSAVDAAVAVALALQVSWPEAGNIGGGGFMLVHPGPKQTPVCIEYRETAPASATEDMFRLDETKLSAKAVGVPGTLRGLELAHQKFGRLPWKELVEPAVQLAAEGVAIDAGLARSLNSVLPSKSERSRFPEFIRIYGKPGGSKWQPGDTLRQPELAATLRSIAKEGADVFYRGRIAQQIVDEMHRGGGLISLQDLAAYEARLREPVRVRFRGYDVFGPPLPSSGGICLAEMLQVLETFNLRSEPRWSPRNVHLQIETTKRVFLDRARYLGDADFVGIPEELTSSAHAAAVAKSIDLQRATPSLELAKDLPIVGESPSTTHFSIVDEDGMAVANTYTLEHSFGSRVVVRGAGFLLNNEMGDFNWKKGVTDTRGHIGTTPNLIAPGKRMLSSQTPVIVLRDGETVLVTGSPGGRTIINTVLCVLLNVLEFEMSLPQAIEAPRFHHAWLPDETQFEGITEELMPELLATLRGMGHRIVFRKTQGDAHSIRRLPNSPMWQGVADTRRSGSAEAY